MEKLLKDCLSREGPHTGAEEGAAKTMCEELTAISIPHSPEVQWRGKETEKIRSKVEPVKKRGVDEKCFKI